MLIGLELIEKRLYRFKLGAHNEAAYMSIEFNSLVAFFTRPFLNFLVKRTRLYPAIVPGEFISSPEFAGMRRLQTKAHIPYMEQKSASRYQKQRNNDGRYADGLFRWKPSLHS